MADLARLNMPLMFTVNEREPVAFQRQGLDMVNAIFRARSELPSFVTLSGHNHYSSILAVGSRAGDILGEHMRCFIAAVSARADSTHSARTV